MPTRRKRTSSDADASQVDAEQSRHIRNQMFSLRTKLNKVDERRQRDRDLLMEAARRNVDATIHDMEMKVYADTGRAPPSIQKEWDEAARERAREEAESTEAEGAQANRVHIGSSRYIEMADVEAVARSRVQPALDDITDQAERRRAEELEARLDAEEEERRAAIERERESSLNRAEKREGVSEKRGSKRLKLFMWKRKSKQMQEEKPDLQEEAVTPGVTTEEPAEEAPAAQEVVDASEAEEVAPAAPEAAQAAAPLLEADATEGIAPAAPEAPQAAAPALETGAGAEAASVSKEAIRQDDSVPETAGATTIMAAAPITAPVQPVHEEVDDLSDIARPHTAPRDAAATGGVSAMHIVQPITSPRADSKLKTWFRDRLVRRTSGPQPIYPHQPGPEFNTDSEVGFTGGAALTGRTEPRTAALSSHPVSNEDLESNHSGDWDMTNSPTEESGAHPEASQNGNGNASSKRQRLRKSFMKSVSRNTQERKSNEISHKRQNSGALSEGGGYVRGLRDSATEQGLPVPPILSETVSTGRESKFSEDL
ncbi:uncharacterized protein N7482_008623 [Penicillium canariense]|uniref:Uncharacterized protein n=1 Tax=Penicillium canariense TaxID=189055 RepID=A0A9W9HTJ8_9EURO|nr:uncharacterized protein N7482_008623 [Penicillium canariense]KAJ5157523.1 hypothetical protein N7482_008623 [Penicillium canariense]